MKPKSLKSFIFFIITSLVCFEFGNTVRNIAQDFQSQNALFSIVIAKNSGGAWSIFQNQTTALAILGIVAIFLLAFYVYKKVPFENKIELVACIFLCTGILGNTCERLVNGHVIDYIKLNFINFPVFNFFDIMICAGAIFYTAFLIFGSKNEDK